MKYTVTIVGLGNVGASIALLLLSETRYRFIINIIEIDENLKQGRFLDLQNANTFKKHELVWNNNQLFSDADFVFHTAGGNIAIGADRDSVLAESKRIVEDIYKGLSFNNSTFFIVISNPVERICGYLNDVLHNEHKNRILGTGTLLDTIRLEGYVSEELNIPIENINLPIIGEHGPGLILLEQHSSINGETISAVQKQAIDSCMNKTLNTAKTIKAIEGHTKFGVAMAGKFLLDKLLDSNPHKTICTVVMNKHYSTAERNNCYMSLPVEFKNKTVSILNLDLTSEQMNAISEIEDKFLN